ncbi:hypothetical protein FDB15_15875 [Clostridium botulinum]|uniref:hypothetical protein n=1 Tax=unclassified Clostridium TaxID=2614128 RepID=UPI0013C545DB|nr:MULTISPECIES: hypothetical protein [unclassified Clostridium]NFI02129.1 hypothetical protein [Clostridium botulinum]NFI64403.1 hypothetical protein [Clostridium botulinum]NFJ45244.1 hypothetical protein [Clostridium botulinum]NFJ48871.1 hypothetical protein [Clostridium botulinum]NFK26716.1 hypothetical protein [Clostridium botulinum]
MDKRLNGSLDKKITECLNKKSDEISAPENMFFKIRAGILEEKNRGVLFNMKIRFLKAKTMIVAGLLCIATTVTCVAATGELHWNSSTSRMNEINKFPTEDVVKKTVGYCPKYVDEFSNGFKFKSFNFSDSSLENDNGDAVIKTKDAYFSYKKDGARKDQSLFFEATPINEEYFNKDSEDKKDITEYNGIKIYYNNFKYKAVPVDYVESEEESKLIQEGTLQIGFGADEISESNTQFVKWYEDGIEYSIMNMAYDDVDKDQMIEMAKTVINK